MPLVSVIVPNYNHAVFLPQRIESVLSQTFTDFELIILDDASTDNSRQVVERYRDDHRVQVFTSQVNSGSPFIQWNKGVSLARGEFVWIAESDDFAKNEFLATLIPRMQANKDLALCYSQSHEIDEAGSDLGSLIWLTDDLDERRWREGFVNNGSDECSRFLVRKCTIPNASAVVFRRSVFEEVGGAPTNLRLCGDWMLWAKMLRHNSIHFEPQPLNWFRRHKSSVRAKTPPLSWFRERSQVQNFIIKNVGVSREHKNAILEERRRCRLSLAEAMVSAVWAADRQSASRVSCLAELVALPTRMPVVLGTRFYWGSLKKMMWTSITNARRN